MKFTLTKPCKLCPFRTDVKGYLTKGRVEEILHSITAEQRSFTCHETNDYDDEDGEAIETVRSQHCAGAMIFLERLNRPNQMMRIAERLGFYDRRRLKMNSPIHTAASMVKAQRGGRASAKLLDLSEEKPLPRTARMKPRRITI